MHVQLADEAICIGKAASNESYLRSTESSARRKSPTSTPFTAVTDFCPRMPILPMCARTAYPVHRPQFARYERPSRIKPSAVRWPRKPGCPTPRAQKGSWKTNRSHRHAKRIGYPIMIKAIAGGGGRGMRVAHNDISLVKGYHTLQRSGKAFRQFRFYIGEIIENPHHIEFQILGDNRGNIIHLANVTAPSSGVTENR